MDKDYTCLSFDFSPKVVRVYGYYNGNTDSEKEYPVSTGANISSYLGIFWAEGIEQNIYDGDTLSGTLETTKSGNTFSYYLDNLPSNQSWRGPQNQFNSSNIVYHYFAIG